MPVDTRNKRASALGRRLPFLRRILPVPDGNINASDRQQVAGVYRIALSGRDDVDLMGQIDMVWQFDADLDLDTIVSVSGMIAMVWQFDANLNNPNPIVSLSGQISMVWQFDASMNLDTDDVALTGTIAMFWNFNAALVTPTQGFVPARLTFDVTLG